MNYQGKILSILCRASNVYGSFFKVSDTQEVQILSSFCLIILSNSQP